MSEQDLQRLADILKSRGEGLAAINSNEANLLQALGGAAQPLPGTQGMGPGGGPIRSYAEKIELATPTTTTTSTGYDPSKDTDRLGGDTHDTSPDDGLTETQKHHKEYLESFENQGSGGSGLKSVMPGYNPPSAAIIHLYDRDSETGNWILRPQGTTASTVFTDSLGNEHSTQAAADTANYNITLQQDKLKTYFKNNLQADTNYDTFKIKFNEAGPLQPELTFDQWKAQNPDVLKDPSGAIKSPQQVQEEYNTAIQSGAIKMVPSTKSEKEQNYSLLPDDEIERIFNEQKVLTGEAAQTQIGNFTDTVSQILLTFNQPGSMQDIETLTFEDIQSQLPAGFEALSEQMKRGIFKKLQDNAVKVGRFTLTPEERAEFTTEAPTVDPVADAGAVTINIGDQTFSEWWSNAGGGIAEDGSIFGPYETLEEARAAYMAEAGYEATAPTVTGTGTVTAPNYEYMTDASGNVLLDDDGNPIPRVTPISAATVSTTMPTVTAPTLDTVDDAIVGTTDAVTVGEIADPGKVAIDEIVALDIENIEAIDDLDDITQLLKDRISGEATSPAQIQLQQTTQNNVRQLLGLEAGATADPAKLRQIRQLYAETQQAAAGQSALLRSQETQQAEQALIDVAKTKGAMEMEAELANLETRRQVAIREGDFESARQLQIAQASLTKVITQANIDRDLEAAELDAETRTNIANLDKDIRLAIQKGNMEQAASLANQKTALEIGIAQADAETKANIANLEVREALAIAQGDGELAADIENQKNTLLKNLKQADLDLQTTLANLEARRILAVEQGKMDLAVALANLEKEIILSRTDAELALKSKALDDAVALASFEGLQALEGVDLKVDLAQMEMDLAEMDFELKEKLANLDADTQTKIAYYIGEYKKEIAKADRDTATEGAYLKLLGTILSAKGLIQSDISAKRNIRAADDQVEGFLDALNSYQYEYKDPNAPGADAGMFVGVMAQDLEKTPMGASFVTDTPQGKMVDYGHGLAAILASQSNLHDRLRQLEEG